MKVLIRGKVYDSKFEPIGIRLSNDDKASIKGMSDVHDTYVAFPKDCPGEKMAEIVNTLKPELTRNLRA